MKLQVSYLAWGQALSLYGVVYAAAHTVTFKSLPGNNVRVMDY